MRVQLSTGIGLVSTAIIFNVGRYLLAPVLAPSWLPLALAAIALGYGSACLCQKLIERCRPIPTIPKDAPKPPVLSPPQDAITSPVLSSSGVAPTPSAVSRPGKIPHVVFLGVAANDAYITLRDALKKSGRKFTKVYVDLTPPQSGEEIGWNKQVVKQPDIVIFIKLLPSPRYIDPTGLELPKKQLALAAASTAKHIVLIASGERQEGLHYDIPGVDTHFYEKLHRAYDFTPSEDTIGKIAVQIDRISSDRLS